MHKRPAKPSSLAVMLLGLSRVARVDTHDSEVAPVEHLRQPFSSVPLNDSLSSRQTTEVEHFLRENKINYGLING